MRNFELKDHLGNVRVMVEDQKQADNTARIASYYNYYAFGMEMPNRTFDADKAYRYGFGSHEKEDEIKGSGNHLNFGDYGLDTRIGRRWNVEPLIFKYPSFSSYMVFGNNPISTIDPDGRFPWPIHFRSFIAASLVGEGSFRGDGRGPSLFTSKEVTSRVNLSFIYDPATKQISNKNIYSDPTIFYGAMLLNKIVPLNVNPIASAKPNFKMTSSIIDFNEMSPKLKSSRSSFGFKYDAKDPITPDFVTPSLDVHANLFFDENIDKGELIVAGKVFGDKFPSTEAFITDQSGKGKIFLGAVKEKGGVGDLVGDNKLRLFDINMTIKFDKSGNFTGVKQGNKNYTVEDWNKEISSNWDSKK